MIQFDKENVIIDEKFQKSCELLLQKWFKKNIDKSKLFEFTNSHLVDISVKILFDNDTKKLLEELIINDPTAFIKIIKNKNRKGALIWSDDSSFDENDDSFSSSYDATLDNSINQPNQNNFNFNLFNYNNNNNYNNYNNNYNNNHRRRRRRNNHNNNHNNHYLNIINNSYEEEIKRYCKAQAYVYVKLVDSKLFKEINWKNKLNDNEDGVFIYLSNNHQYKVKKDYSDYDFTIKNRSNITYKISVKNGEGYDLKFTFKNTQWNALNNELISVIFAFVSLRDENNPDIIHFSKNILLNEL